MMQVIFAIATLLFFACFLYPVFKPAFGAVKAGYRIRQKTKFKMEGVLAKANQRLEAITTEAVEVLAALPVIPEALKDKPEHQAAVWTNVLHFGPGGSVIKLGTQSRLMGYVLLRGYSDRVERDLVISSTTLAKKLGSSRIKLNAFSGSHLATSSLLAEDTQKIVAPILNGGGALLNDAVQAPKPTPVSVKEPVRVEEEKEKFVPTTETKTKPRVMPSWKGELVSYGYGERALSKQDDSDDDSGDHTLVKQYRVVLMIDGQEESIWGQDLHRAIKDSLAIKGDTIEVVQTGRKPLPNKRSMILYSIKKLA